MTLMTLNEIRHEIGKIGRGSLPGRWKPIVSELCDELDLATKLLERLRAVSRQSTWLHLEGTECDCKSCTIAAVDAYLLRRQKG